MARRTIREELKRAFLKKGWTYLRAGQELGISQTSAFRKLNGEQVIGIEELPRFAKVLGVRVSVKGAA